MVARELRLVGTAKGHPRYNEKYQPAVDEIGKQVHVDPVGREKQGLWSWYTSGDQEAGGNSSQRLEVLKKDTRAPFTKL